jgi:glucokinase
LVVGVDVGGTKIAAAVVDSAGQIYGRVQHPTDVSRPEMTLQSIAGAITGAIEAADVRTADISAIGLGIPGKVDPETGTGLVAVNLGWRNVPVTPALEAQLGIRCAIENDVRAGEKYGLPQPRHRYRRGLYPRRKALSWDNRLRG